MIKKALLIIDVQKSAVGNSDIPARLGELQYNYGQIYISKFVNTDSPLLRYIDFDGYEDADLAFDPAPDAVIFEKNIYSSFLPEMTAFDEIHLCGFDTDACIYKTAMDLIEHNVRPVILSEYCGSESEEYHQAGMLLLERNIGRENIVYKKSG